VVDGLADGIALGVEDGFLGGDGDDGFHGESPKVNHESARMDTTILGVGCVCFLRASDRFMV
jgi:hypothetical protein